VLIHSLPLAELGLLERADLSVLAFASKLERDPEERSQLSEGADRLLCLRPLPELEPELVAGDNNVSSASVSLIESEVVRTRALTGCCRDLGTGSRINSGRVSSASGSFNFDEWNVAS
jgi:hypothetical protein